MIPPARIVGKYTSDASISRDRNALFKRRIARIHMDTSNRIRNANVQSFLSSGESVDSAKLKFSFFSFAFKKSLEWNVQARSIWKSPANANWESSLLEFKFRQFDW